MPLDDRDWYNPKEFRKRPPDESIRRIGQQQGPNLFIHLLLLTVICAVLFGGFWLLNDYQKAKQQAQAATIAAEYWKQKAEESELQLSQLRKAQRLDFFKP